ncbi:uncharacterized protein LOC134533028 [Bacillus rossius redtenbacheri]|uniref:uncharacterized protein LOC134533028 n=1 Tax=Bacillus rossius redtenbacheri TaxID=93214 RepID=UPI002FDDB64B
MALKFYYDLLSQPCRAVMIFLKTNKIPFDPEEINLSVGEQYTETFGQLNRFRKLPVIADGDFVLTESVAILRYLCREKDVPDHWYPKDSKQQAIVDEYLEWQHLNTRLNVSVYMLRKFLLPTVTGKPASTEKVAEALKNMEKTLNHVETKWLLDGQLYLTGSCISIADLLGACEIEQSIGYVTADLKMAPAADVMVNINAAEKKLMIMVVSAGCMAAEVETLVADVIMVSMIVVEEILMLMMVVATGCVAAEVETLVEDVMMVRMNVVEEILMLMMVVATGCVAAEVETLVEDVMMVRMNAAEKELITVAAAGCATDEETFVEDVIMVRMNVVEVKLFLITVSFGYVTVEMETLFADMMMVRMNLAEEKLMLMIVVAAGFVAAEVETLV